MTKRATGASNWTSCTSTFTRMSEATPVVSIRASNRKELDLARKERRFRATTFQRVGIEQHISKNYTPEALHEMAVKLRKKKNVDKEFLTQLSQALAENRQNATVFMGVDGVLQALCSFLTGLCPCKS